MQITTEKCFLNVNNETKRAFRVDILNDYKKAIYDNEKKCYVTEDWDIIPRRDFYPDNLVSIYYLKTLINFDDTWESDLPVFQAEFPVYTHAKE